MDRDTQEELDNAVAELPDDLRLPLTLHYQEGFRYREIAETLGCPEGTVGRRISEARDQLRQRLAPRGAGIGAAGLATALATLPSCQVPDGLEDRVLERVELARLEATAVSPQSEPLPPTSTVSLGTVLLGFGLLVVGVGALVALSSRDTLAPPAEPIEEARRSVEESAGDPRSTTSLAVRDFDREIPEETPSALKDAGLPADRSPVDFPEISGTVRDRSGVPIRNATVSLLLAPSGSHSATAETDATGYYEFVTVPVLQEEDPEVAKIVGGLGGAKGGEARARLERELLERLSGVAAGTPTPPTETTDTTESTLESDEEDAPEAMAQQAVQTMTIAADTGFQIEVIAVGYQPARSRYYASSYIAEPGPSERVDFDLLAGDFLTGLVRDRQGNPIPDALVDILAYFAAQRLPSSAVHEAWTEGDGRFAFHSLPPGPCLLQARAPGYLPARQVVGRDRRVEPLVLAEAGSIAVNAVEETGAPFRGATVVVFLGNRRWGVAADAEGRVTIPDLPPGPVAIELFEKQWSSFPLVRRELLVRGGTEIAVTLEAPQSRTLRGHVATSHAEGLDPRLHISAFLLGRRDSPNGHPTVQVNDSGGFQLRYLPSGRYGLAIVDHSKGQRTLVLGRCVADLRDGDETTVEIRYEPERTGNLIVEVTDVDGQPIPKVNVHVRMQDLDMHVDHVRTDSHGETTHELYPADYELFVSARGYRSAELEGVSVAENTDEHVRVRLLPIVERGPSAEELAELFGPTEEQLQRQGSMTLGELFQIAMALEHGKVDIRALTSEHLGQEIYTAQTSNAWVALHYAMTQRKLRWEIVEDTLRVRPE